MNISLKSSLQIFSLLLKRPVFQPSVVMTLLLCTMIFQPLAAQQPETGFSQVYSLQHAPVDRIEPQLREMLSAVPGKQELFIDRQNNRISLQGSPEAHKLAAQMISALDRPGTAGKAAPPNQSPAQLKPYPMSRQQISQVAAELRKRYPSQTGVRIATDHRTGQILIWASPEVHRQIDQQIQRLSNRSFGNTRTGPAPNNTFTQPIVEVAPPLSFQLSHINWQRLETSLANLWGQKLSITTAQGGRLATIILADKQGKNVKVRINRSTGDVKIEGPQPLAGSWARAIRALDQAPQAKDRQIQLVALHYAKRSNVQHALAALQSTNQTTSSGETVQALFPTENRKKMRWGGDLISMIFQPQGGNNAAAGNPPAVEGGGLIGEVQIEYLEGSDVIIIRGHQRDVQRVREIIKQIEEISKITEPIIEVHMLKHVNSVSMGTMVTELYETMFAQRIGRITITPLVKPNALLLIGREDRVKTIVKLVEQLDNPVERESEHKLIQLRHLPAGDAVTIIREFYGEQIEEGTDENPGRLATRVRVSADIRSNSIIVQASPRDLVEIVRLIEEIDVSESKSVNVARVFKIRNSLATELAQLLLDALTGQSDTQTSAPRGNQGGGGPQGGGPQNQGGGGRQGSTNSGQRARSAMLTTKDSQQRILTSGILTDVRVSANAAANTLLVTGPAESMELIASLIQQLDQLPEAESQIKIFPIENGDATSMVNMLRELFDPQQNQGQQAIGITESSIIPLRFTTELRTNSIIATGSLGDLIVVEAIILKLDSTSKDQRINEVYRLRFTNAEDVANTILDFLQSEQNLTQQQIQQFVQGGNQTGQVFSPFEQIEQEVTVVAETMSNSLIISATPKFFDDIMEIIKKLDAIPPQVMIQLLIAEVSYNEEQEFGLELGLQDSLLFQKGVVLGSPIDPNQLNTLERLSGQVISSLALGQFNATQGFGGLVLSGGNESISVLLRALQARSYLKVLSRPQIMTLDNQPAVVQVGANVRIASGTNTTTNGLVNLTTTAEEIGLILNVLPRISPNGDVVLLLQVTNSALGPEASGTPIAIDANGNVTRSPRINLTTASTTITVPNGQTAVFSGLITSRKSYTHRGIPWLSDLPGIGKLFSYEDEIEQRTELLIIMTPHVIRNQEDMQMVNTMESARMSWCLADVVSIHGDVGLVGGNGSWHDSEITTIYPDDNPVAPEVNRQGPGTRALPVVAPSRPSAPPQQSVLRLPAQTNFLEQSPQMSVPPVQINSRQMEPSPPASSSRRLRAAAGRRTQLHPVEPASYKPMITAKKNRIDPTQHPARLPRTGRNNFKTTP